MQIGFLEFLRLILANPLMLVTVVLTLAVILVNGWTDAPNAIATCVSTRAMDAKWAILMAAVLNFLGVLIMTLINSKIVKTIFNMVDFAGSTNDAVIALCAALVAIVLWAVAAWKFGIPTSESHALIAGLSGAAIALQGSLAGINWSEWVKVLYGLALSTVLGFAMGFLMTKLTELIFRNADRRKTAGVFKGAQIFGAASMAFMHGAQDGQKFMSVFLLGIFLVRGQSDISAFSIPLWLMVLCSLVMGLGTSIGGYRIIKSVGMDMVKLSTYQGFSADMAAASCLLFSSLTGIPVSTTHTKTTAIMGVGAAKRIKAVNWSVVKEMVLTWLLTFPGCGLLGFAMAKVFILIF
ncbi:MAG: Low-affinity inorganic phosphate transporter 1 [Betaproteobacteria bacterium ADurb.Bin341]|nr:MAG: Low-affinity inorganic phosphate transporter 1 [Betaproteobacteria bacterium ADurb.Bin341]